MRNAVKAVVDAKTCGITLYALDVNEPITAAWNAIYPGLLTPFDHMSMYLRSHLRYPVDLFSAQAGVYASVHVQDASVFFNGSDRYRISQEQINGQQQDTQPYYIEATLPGATTPSFVLFQTFSPGTSGSGSNANNMTAWLAAQCNYTETNHPHLVSVRLNNADNVLGPLQFDNNINADPTVSSFPAALQNLLNTTQPIPGLPTGPAPSPPTSPTPTPTGPSTTPTPTPTTTLQQQILAAVNTLIADNAAAQAALQAGDYTTYGKDEAKVQQDIKQLQQLLQQAGATATPSPSP
jgi:uncharacterized membrane protein (UPF0182 family)